MHLRELWDRVVCVLYPPRCVLCGEVVRYEDTFCAGCSPQKSPMSAPAHGALAGVVSPFAYEDGAQFAVRTLKEYRDRRTLCFFAQQMQEVVGARWTDAFDLVVPVPASRRTLRARGFNQAGELAVVLARRMGIACRPRALARSSRARTQHVLSAEERRQNAVANYTLRDAHGLRGKKVLLVDDVLTTGATLETCAALLTGAGAVVYGVSATYTPRQGADDGVFTDW